MVVLNVDDDSDNLEMFCEALREVNPAINCLKAVSGKEALDLLYHSDQLPDYIFLDMNMPFMDGRSCLKRIRHDEKLSDIRVFMLSSSCNRREIEECRNLGAHFLRKEISHRRLVDLLKRVIKEN